VSAQGKESVGDAQGRGRGRAGDPAGEGGPPRLQGLQEEPRLINLGSECLLSTSSLQRFVLDLLNQLPLCLV
jgi:hypothetical protein